LFLLGAFFFLGLFYSVSLSVREQRQDTASQFVFKTVRVQGEVLKMGELRLHFLGFPIRVSEIDEQTAQGTMFVILPAKLAPELRAGDIISFETKITKPSGMTAFGPASFFLKQGVFTLAWISKKEFEKSHFQILSYQNRLSVAALSERMKTRFSGFFDRVLPRSHAAIADGILFGKQDGLSPLLKEQFRNSGLIHLLVASGFNISLLLFFVFQIFQKFGRRIVFFAGFFFLGFFLLLTPLEPPILRAAFMGSLVLISQTIGWGNDVRNTLLFSAVVLGIFNPRMIHSDLSFFLSFFATAGIVLFVPFFEKVFSFLPEKFHLRSLLSISFAAQVAVFPLLGLFFQSFPVIGIVANLFAEPIVPFAIVGSVFAGTFGFFFPFLGKLFGLSAYFFLHALIFLASFFGKIPPVIIPRTFSLVCLFVVLFFFLRGFLQPKMQENCLKFLEPSRTLET